MSSHSLHFVLFGRTNEKKEIIYLNLNCLLVDSQRCSISAFCFGGTGDVLCNLMEKCVVSITFLGLHWNILTRQFLVSCLCFFIYNNKYNVCCWTGIMYRSAIINYFMMKRGYLVWSKYIYCLLSFQWDRSIGHLCTESLRTLPQIYLIWVKMMSKEAYSSWHL